MIVFDKAKWHYEGKFPEGRDNEYAFVHTGFFVCWLALRGGLSEECNEDFAPEIQQLRDRTASPIHLYWVGDGVFESTMVDPSMLGFVQNCFDGETFPYFQAYGKLFGEERAGAYAVEPTWENYELVAQRLDELFAKSEQAESKR